MAFRRLSFCAGLSVAALSCLHGTAQANVYPSGFNMTAGTVTVDDTCEALELVYVINENADGQGGNPGLKIEVLNGSNVAVRTITRTTIKKGVYSFLWDGRKDDGTAATNGTYTVKITTSDDGYAVPTQTSSDANTFLQFENPRSLCVNTDPTNSRYGRIYVNEKRDGTTASGRSVTAGIFMLNADGSDALGQGDSGFTGGLTWTGTSPIYEMRTLEFGQDGNIYIGDDLDGNSNIYRVDADVSGGSGAQMLQGVGDTAGVHGSIASSVVALGSLATNNLQLYAVDEDGTGVSGGFNAFYRWDVNGGPIPFGGAPAYLNHHAPTWIQFAQPMADLDRGPDGKWYMCQNRAANQTQSSVFVFDTDGTTLLWDSKTATGGGGLDVLLLTWSLKVSPDGTYLAVQRQDMKCFVIPLVSGIPNWAGRIEIQTFPAGAANSGADVAWDRANNLYFCDYRDGGELVRIYSLGTGAHSNSTTSSQITLNKAGGGGPTINTQPADTTGYIGQSANFTVVATGSGPTYQWWRNGVKLSGEIGASLTLNNLTAANDGNLVKVVVCDGNGTRVSRDALLTVTVAPPCPDPFAKADGDDDVDQADFGAWQKCYTGAGDPAGQFDANTCSCFDRDNDHDIDSTDFTAFNNCWSGPSVSANPACDD